MNLKDALKWADVWGNVPSDEPNGNDQALLVLANTVRTYADWIHSEGKRNNTCTYNILGEVCGYCECKRKVKL